MKKLIPVLIFILALSSCKSLSLNQKPTAKIEKFDIESISLRDITFLFDISIKNPYPVALKLDDIKLKFSVENKQLIKTNTAKGLRIRANGKEITTFRVNLKYKDIARIVKDYSKKDYLNCLVDVTIVIPLPKIPGLKKNALFNYKLSKKIPAIKPTIKITNFKVKKPSLSDISNAIKKSRKSLNKKKIFGMFNDIISGKKPKKIVDPKSLDVKLDVKFDIELTNNTKARLKFTKLNYEFFINSGKLVTGETEKFSSSGKKSILSISNSFSSKNLGKSILNAFRKKKGNFSLKGYALIKLPDSIKTAPLKLKFDEKGGLKIK